MLKDLYNKYNYSLPRYTSYPPANYFRGGFPDCDYIAGLQSSNFSSTSNISVYIHIPFCQHLCHYCGCNAMILKDRNVLETYVSALVQEMYMVFGYLDRSRKVSQIHFGGGTPSILSLSMLEMIVGTVFDTFAVIDNPEIAMECHPAYLDLSYLAGLKANKFNRISLGIQDFDTRVLQLVNRKPSSLQVHELVAYIHNEMNASVNLDFIYGLPGQTANSFVENMWQAVSMHPNRLVTFPYAHLPKMFTRQSILEKKGLPASGEKNLMFSLAADFLELEGYRRIGMDHFVLPSDELWLARQKQQLHRNFQGYCSKRTTGQVYAFGLSGISQLDQYYVQNTKDLERYLTCIKNKKLPVEKGYHLSMEEQQTKDAITALMCNNSLNDYMNLPYVNHNQLLELQNDGILVVDGGNIQITPTGEDFVRYVAACFDPLLSV